MQGPHQVTGGMDGPMLAAPAETHHPLAQVRQGERFHREQAMFLVWIASNSPRPWNASTPLEAPLQYTPVKRLAQGPARFLPQKGRHRPDPMA